MGLQRYDSEVPSYLLQCCLSIGTDSFLLTLCRDERERDKLDLMIVSIILILQRLLLVLITFCTIYVVCKSSDLHCAPNNSRAVCLSCSSLSLLLWKQIVPCFIGRIFFFSVTDLVMMHQELRVQASFSITRCFWKSFWRMGDAA